MVDRRVFILGAAASLAACAGYPEASRGARMDLRALEAALGPGGRLGVAALDTGSARSLLHDADGRYAMCSTFKAPLAAAILEDVDAGRRSLADEIVFGEADLLSYAPVVRARLAEARLSLADLCGAIVEVSDNSAANLLLAEIGGPAALTRRMRAWGDRVSRLDRNEPELNTNLPGDPRDTTSPAAMAGLMRTLVLGDALSAASRALLAGWLVGATTGRERLRAGLPPSWRVGDKTGTGMNGAHNDVAIAWPPRRAPIVIASYIDGGTADAALRDRTHAAVARIAAAALA